jgi:uncharacterized membrane protein YhaH (DUF805 family)
MANMMSPFSSKLIAVLQPHLNYRALLSRKQYGQFCLAWAAIAIVLSLLNPLALVLFSWVSFPFFFIKSLQRLNDMERNRWFIALGFLPVVGFLFFIYTLFAPSKIRASQQRK